MNDDEESSSLHSIERSNVSGIKRRSAARRVRISREQQDAEPSARQSSRRPSGRQAPRRSSRPMGPPRRPMSRRRRGSVKKILVVLLVTIAVLLTLLTLTFATARLDLVLETADVEVDGVFSAVRDPARSRDISYSKLGPFRAERDATITNITRERQNTYAEGTIIIYNANVSGEKLDLVNRTRFQNEDGRIYRLTSKQVVPGGKDVNGEFVPGRKEVKVVADRIGTEFNIRKKGERFSIPGLAKYKEFSKSYAVSSSEIVGGFRGERFIPDPVEEEQARERLRKEIRAVLEDKLVETLNTNTFSQSIVFDAGKFITYNSLENEQTEDGVILKEQGTLHAVSFRENDLAALLAKAGDVSNDALKKANPVNVNVTNLNMEMVADKEFDVISSTEFEFRLSGNARLFWGIDEVLLLGHIKGKNKAEVEAIRFDRYPQIVRIDTFSIFPFWRSTLPNNTGKIDVTVEHTDE